MFTFFHMRATKTHNATIHRQGIAHMHSMPEPMVHRDVKSGNIMVIETEDRMVGKLGDCGESRRVDLNATMTQTGSPLWAAVSLFGRYEIWVKTCCSS